MFYETTKILNYQIIDTVITHFEINARAIKFHNSTVNMHQVFFYIYTNVNWLFKSVCVFSILVLFVGNVDVWHGNNDILVKHTAITMGRRAEVPEPEDKSVDEEIYPLPAQKRFTPDDSSQNYY